MTISGTNYQKIGVGVGVYKYVADEGYHFESYGYNYGRVIYDNGNLNNPYIIKKD